MGTVSTTDRICKVIDQHSRSIHAEVRKVFKGVRALCAATQSAVLIHAGIINGWHPWCADLANVLRKLGWQKAAALSALVKGALCFTVDANHNGSPDHVYTFLGWLDEPSGVALVYDNYSPVPHPRNVGKAVWYKGKRLAYGRFDFALLPPA